MDLTTVAALRKFGEHLDVRDDTILNGLIQASSEAIEKYCDRTFRVDTETEHHFVRRSAAALRAGILNHFDGPVLLLDEDLAEAPSSMISGGDAVTAVTYLTAHKPPYWGIVLDEGSWVSPAEITGFWAYSKTPPPSIEFACLRLSKWLYELRETTRGDAVVVTEQGAVLLPSAIPGDIQALLNPFRRVRLAAQ